MCVLDVVGREECENGLLSARIKNSARESTKKIKQKIEKKHFMSCP